MAATRRDVLRGGASLVGARVVSTLAASGLLWPGVARAEWTGGGVRSLGHSLVGDPKYPDDFTQTDYVVADAPKGGRARIDASGRFDSFNPFIAAGTPTGATFLAIESLMSSPLDEGSTHYGLVAEWMETAPDESWVAFKIRDEARWHDGRPITAADVTKSFELVTTEGRPLYRFYYQDVSEVVDEGGGVVRFKFSTTGNRELPHIVGQLPVLPAHYWESRTFGDATLEPMLGSGPYAIGDFEAGRYIEMVLKEDYWGADLPINRGHWNFGQIRFEFFLDRDAAFEAFKKGEIDYWNENSAKRWAERFDFPAAADGKIKKEEVFLDGPKRVQGFVFNQRRARFSDRRVREALSLVFDFEWSNRSVFFDQYARPTSFFQGSAGLTAEGAPEGLELSILEPFRDQLREEIFGEVYRAPVTDASGRIRRQRRQATALLAEAGYEVRDRVLYTPEGQPFELEFLVRSASQEPVIAPYLKNLELLGVQATFRLVDPAQYVRRVRAFDFDMIVDGWRNTESPGNEQRDYWSSAVVDRDGSRNSAGVSSPVVDALIERIVLAEDRETLEAATRALDRVLLWEHAVVLQLYTPYERIAYWDRFSHPEPLPTRAIGFTRIWWFDAEKDAEI